MSVVPPGPAGLVCPECGAPVVDAAPPGWSPGWGPCPAHAHADGSPLCPVPAGYRPADPIPADRARAVRAGVPSGPPWPGHAGAAVRRLAVAVHRLSQTLTAPDAAGQVEAVTAGLIDTLAAVTGCCDRLEAVIAATDPRAGRRMVQATGAAEHLVIRLTDVCVALGRR